MGTSIKLDGTDSSNKTLYWDPTGVAVKSYSSSSTAATPTLSGARNLQDDFVWLDCCFSEDGKTIQGKYCEWIVPENGVQRRDFTFAWGFNSPPVVLACHSNTDQRASMALTFCQIEATINTGFCMKMLNGNDKSGGTHFDILWIAVGK